MNFMRKPFPCFHICGLDLPDGENMTVEMNEGSQSYIFRTDGGYKHLLPKSKITNISRKNNDVVEVIEKPSLGYAALGAFGFGILGALLGLLATSKQERVIKIDRALVFDYIDGDMSKQIRCGYVDDKGLNMDWWRPDVFEKDFIKHRGEYAQV